MSTYYEQHADLFRAVGEILVLDYIAPSETAETVEYFCNAWPHDGILRGEMYLMEPSELAALIADVEGYERRDGK